MKRQNRRWLLAVAVAGVAFVGLSIYLFASGPAEAEKSRSDAADAPPLTHVSGESIRHFPSTAAPADESAASSATANTPMPITEPTSPASLTEAEMRAAVLGYWFSEYYGKRYLNIRDDGTATILFQASTFASMFVGSKMRLEYNWTYDPTEQQVVFTMTGGQPRKSLDYVTQMWGGEQRQKIVTISSAELRLLELDGKTEHRWSRLDAIPEATRKTFESLAP